MYGRLVPFRQTDRGLRLPPMGGCLPRANPMVVPVAPVEVPALAGRFPIAWREAGGGIELVCLCGLAPDHPLPGGGAEAGADLPLLLLAYPLTVVDDGATDTLGVLRDEDAPETDGAPAFGENGEPVGDAEKRCQALWAFSASRRGFAAVAADLQAAGAFAPWDLDLSRQGLPISITGLLAVDAAFLGTEGHRRVVETHGWTAAQVLTIHRASLFRVADLVREYGRVRAPRGAA